MRKTIPFLMLAAALSSARAADLHPPGQATAGNSISIPTTGSGKATFYLIGPASAIKRQVQAGSDIAVDGDDLQNSGRYIAILCGSDGCMSSAFFVNPAVPNRLSLQVHPSRVPVASVNGISAVAFVFDNFHNLVLTSPPVKFSILPKDGKEVSANRPVQQGIAWVRLTSARKQGTTKIGAAIGRANEIRVVEQVAAEACNLRIHAHRDHNGFLVETDPVRDCAGNPVPDGTVVSFTMSDAAGKTTVDVPIKRGVAKIAMPIKGRARISAASGVVTGNELEVGG
jgi:hypothetical protein